MPNSVYCSTVLVRIGTKYPNLIISRFEAICGELAYISRNDAQPRQQILNRFISRERANLSLEMSRFIFGDKLSLEKRQFISDGFYLSKRDDFISRVFIFGKHKFYLSK